VIGQCARARARLVEPIARIRSEAADSGASVGLLIHRSSSQVHVGFGIPAVGGSIRPSINSIHRSAPGLDGHIIVEAA
jgi:hypothetical protein